MSVRQGDSSMLDDIAGRGTGYPDEEDAALVMATRTV
jgi:hypothetical protein